MDLKIGFNLKWETIQRQSADSISGKYVHIIQILYNMTAVINITYMQQEHRPHGLFLSRELATLSNISSSM